MSCCPACKREPKPCEYFYTPGCATDCTSVYPSRPWAWCRECTLRARLSLERQWLEFWTK